MVIKIFNIYSFPAGLPAYLYAVTAPKEKNQVLLRTRAAVFLVVCRTKSELGDPGKYKLHVLHKVSSKYFMQTDNLFA